MQLSDFRAAIIIGGATLLRYVLITAGAGGYLSTRIEVSTMANGMLPVNEGIALLRIGVSPYRGATCHVPPLVLWLLSCWMEHGMLAASLHVVADIIAATLLRRISQLTSASVTQAHGVHDDAAFGPDGLMAIYLFNPFSIMACITGTTTSLENLCVVAAIHAACAGSLVCAAFATACGAYLGVHPLLLIIPLSVLLASGPRSCGTQESAGHGNPAMAVGCGPQESKAGACSVSSNFAVQCSGNRPAQGYLAGTQTGLTAAAGGASYAVQENGPQEQQLGMKTSVKTSAKTGVKISSHVSSQSASCLPCFGKGTARMRGVVGTCIGLVAMTAVFLLGLLACSDAVLSAHPEEQCVPLLRKQIAGALSHSHATAPGGTANEDLLHDFSSSSLPGCWAVHVYRLHLLFTDLTPNIGQWWYFFAQMFPAHRSFFCFVSHALCGLFAIPAAIRFPKQGLLLAVLQIGISTMLRPYPSLGDLGLYLSLLPLLKQQLQQIKIGLFLCNSLLLLCVLGPAMWTQWIDAESANSNFFYSMTMLLGAWHTLLLVQLLLSSVGMEQP